MSVNIIVEQVIARDRQVVDENSGVSLRQAFSHLWKHNFQNGAFVLDITATCIKVTKRISYLKGVLETTTYTGYMGKVSNIQKLIDIGFIHRHTNAKRMGVINDEETPEHLKAFVQSVDKEFRHNLSNNEIIMNAYFELHELKGCKRLALNKKESAFYSSYVDDKPAAEVLFFL